MPENIIVLKKLSTQAVSLLLEGIIQAASIMILSRLLTEDDFGMYGIAFVIQAFASTLAQAGVGSCVVQNRKDDPVYRSTAFWVSCSLSLIIYLGLFVVAPCAAHFNREPQLTLIVRTIGVVIVLNSLSAVPRAILQRELRYLALMVCNVVSSILGSLILCTLLAYQGYGVWSVVWGFILCSGLRCVMMTCYSGFVPNLKATRDDLAQILRFGIPLTLARVFNIVNQHADKLLLGVLMSIGLLGCFDRALQILLLSTLYFGSTMDTVLFPVLSRHADQKGDHSGVFVKLIELFSLVVLPVGILLTLFAPMIHQVMLGPKWDHIRNISVVLTIAFSFMMFSRLSDCLFRSFGRTGWIMNMKLLAAVLSTVAILLGSRAGLEGVACGFVISKATLSIVSIVTTALVLRFFDGRLLRSFVPGIRVALVSGVIGFGVIASVDGLSTSSPLVVLCISAIITIILCLSLIAIRPKLLGANGERLFLSVCQRTLPQYYR